MKTKAFSFDLPERLIAQHPSDRRESARLLLVDRRTGDLADHRISELPSLLPRPCVLVLNDSRVRKARLYATDESGRTAEFLLLHSPDGGRSWESVTRGARKRTAGEVLEFPGGQQATVGERNDGTLMVHFSRPLDEAYFAEHGHVPLPPYIRREDAPEDESRYQTVYARAPGSVAAPTAGLHFTQKLLAQLGDVGIEITTVTLHVGLGTFAPVRSEEAENHRMHAEWYEVSQETARTVTDAKRLGIPVAAVGTTAVRTLESAWDGARLVPGRGETRLFILPGYSFSVVDHLFTNFHTPESTLLMLVAAFAGYDVMMTAYAHAVRTEYRFFSYGDAMLIR